MIVSYTDRLLCLTSIGVGLSQMSLELLLWSLSRMFLNLFDAMPARPRERLLFALQMVPFLGAILLTACLWIPYYARGEGDLGPERVGWFSLAAGAVVALWFGMAPMRGLRLALTTARFARACRSVGRAIDCRRIETPILSLPEGGFRIALVGLFKPMICLPQSQIDGSTLTPQALEIVLDHEQSHATQLDNWKLFFLMALPRLRLRLSGGASWMQLWQSAAEWAADDDAVRGDSARAFLLAETIVAGSRQLMPRSQHVVATMLVSSFGACEDRDPQRTGLESRIDRLLFQLPVEPAKYGSRLLPFAIAALGIAVALVSMAPDFHELSEYLLHLG
jgi:hypothetical protein